MERIMTNNLFDINGKCILVTGSSRGLGLTIAKGLAAAGAIRRNWLAPPSFSHPPHPTTSTAMSFMWMKVKDGLSRAGRLRFRASADPSNDGLWLALL